MPVSSPGSTGWAQLAFSANPVEQPVAEGVHRDGEADEEVMNAAHDQRADAAEQRRLNCAGTISDSGLQRRRSLPLLFECECPTLSS